MTGPAFRPPGRLQALPRYPLSDIPEARARLEGAGRHVMDLGAGDPGLPVPRVAVEALRRSASDSTLQGYAFQRGLPAYREAVAEWLERRFGRRLDPDRQVLPLLGSKEGLAHLASAVTDPGDVVLVPDPGYAPYLGGSSLAGATVVRTPLTAERGFRVSPERVRDVEGRLRLVYLNYPNNPTGATVDRAYLERMAAACRERGAVLALDNPYSELYYDESPPPGLLEIDGGLEGLVEFHSFSKSFNMTGWRLGWACGDPRILAALARVKSFFDTGVYLPIQAAGAATLERAEDFLRENRCRLAARRDAAVAALTRVGFDVAPPPATLYLWLPVPTGEPAEEFARRALEEAAVILMPGTDLGDAGEGYVRAALTLPPDGYAEAAERLAELR